VKPTTTNPVTATVNASGNSGDLLVSADPNGGQFNCGDGFLHAPSILSESNTFTAPTGAIVSTESFPAADGKLLNAPVPGDSTTFWVCFQANQSFVEVTGKAPPDVNGTYTGLLPLCDPFPADDDAGPCVNYISDDGTTVTEQVTYPASFATSSDPKKM